MLLDISIQIVLILIWLPLNLLIITGLLRGEYKRFPLIFAYVIVVLLATAAELPSYWAVYQGSQSENFRVFIYWMDEIISQVLIYAVVLDLIYRASADLASRRVLRTVLISGALTFAAVSFLIHHQSHQGTGIWMTPWVRDLGVCAAILDLALWTLLIASRKKDHRLLLLSGALGIQFTGEAIGNSVIQLAAISKSHPVVLLGGVIAVSAGIVRSYMWWRVFQKAPLPNAPPLRPSTLQQ